MKVLIEGLILVSVNLILFFIGAMFLSSHGVFDSSDTHLMKGYMVMYFVFLGLPSTIFFLKRIIKKQSA